VTAGLTFKVLSQSLGEASAAASAVDFGALYRPAVLRGGQIGLAVQNAFGGSLDLGGSAPSLGRSLRVGLASPEWRWGGRNALRGILDLGKQGPEPMTSRAGVEMTRAGWGSLRAGLNAGHPVLGAGVTWRRYGIDVAIAQGEVETMHQIALHVAWGEPLSQYEERRRAQYQKAAEESLLARSTARHALDRAKAEASETSGDWETALVLWEVIARERPEDAAVARRAAKAREEVSAKARRAVDEETARRLASTLAALTRDALGRGDLEEAEGFRRGLDLHAGAAGTAYADSLTQLATALDLARAREASRSAARADSLHRQGRVLESAEAAALALRLDPNQAQARDVWSALQGSVGKSANDAAALARKLDALTAVHAASQAFNGALHRCADGGPEGPRARPGKQGGEGLEGAGPAPSRHPASRARRAHQAALHPRDGGLLVRRLQGSAPELGADPRARSVERERAPKRARGAGAHEGGGEPMSRLHASGRRRARC
jgi:hypothetical protein